MSEELTIFRDLIHSLRDQSPRYEQVFEAIADLQDKVNTILFSSKEELAYYLTCDDPALRELAERRYQSYES